MMKKTLRRVICAMLCVLMLVGLVPVQAENIKLTYGRITKDDVFFRYEPSSSAGWKFKMPLNTIVVIRQDKGDTAWYGIEVCEPGVSYLSKGYVSASCLEVLTAEQTALYAAAGYPATYDFSAKEEAPADPAPSDPAPSEPEPSEPEKEETAGGEEEEAVSKGYVTIKKGYNSLNLRKTAGGTYAECWYLSRTKVLPLTGETDTKNGVLWYEVTFTNGKDYFANSDFLALCDAKGNLLEDDSDKEEEESTTGPDTTGDPTGYVKTTEYGVNLRRTPAGTAFSSLTKGLVVPYYGTPEEEKGYDWYYIVYKNEKGYIRSDCLYECDKDGNKIDKPEASEPEDEEEPSTPSTGGKGVIKLTADEVNFRKTPAGSMIKRLPKGTLLTYTETAKKNGILWYKAEDPAGDVGYIHQNVCKVISSSSSSSPSEDIILGYLELTKSGVNLRKTVAGTSQEQLKKGLKLPILDEVVEGDVYDWYYVKAPSGNYGFVRSDCIKLVSSDSLPTPEPEETPTYDDYVIITKNSTNFRKTAGGDYIKSLSKESVYPVTGDTESAKGYDWYPILVGSTKGYVRDDCADLLTEAQKEAYLKGEEIPEADPEDIAAEKETNYIITILDDVNLRESASKQSKALYNVDEGTVMGYSLKQKVGSVEWYKAVYKNTQVWVMGSCVDVMTGAEFKAWQEANPDADAPATEVIAGYVKTTDSGVNLRQVANGRPILGQLSKGLVLPYSEHEIINGHYWYRVSTTLGTGYIVDSCVVLCDKDGNKLTTSTPSTDGEGKPEATYTTLRLGSKGEDVTRMVTELKEQGYYTAAITDSFNSTVEAAVKAFQKDKNLDVDGIAGPATLHTLFGTVPVGGGSASSGAVIYPVEYIEWTKMNSVYPRGKTAQVVDVRTGITFWVKRWAGGQHADVEPLTAADAAQMCKIYKVNKTSEILENKHYHRRPIWLTYNGHTYAGSMYGVPHNYPDGDTLPNNDFKGQFCLHFTNSKVHNDGSPYVDVGHQNAVKEAYNTYWSKK